ncbi:hypothetical protein BH09SUM1_BH09SUM1_24220 [soil metagenome]
MMPMKRILPAVLVLLSAAATAHAAPLVAAASNAINLNGNGAGTDFAKPVLGEKVTCGGIERQIAVLNPSITVGEPLLLRLILRAEIPEKEPEFTAQLAYGTDFDIIIDPPGRVPPCHYHGTKAGTNVPTAVLNMAGMTTTRLDFRLAMDTDTVTGAAFDLVGDYTLQISLACRAKDAEATPMVLGTFTVHVADPIGDDRKALEMLGVRQDFSVFQSVQAHSAKLANQKQLVTPEQIKLFERAVEQAQKASIRAHLMFVLADHYDRNEHKTEASLAMLKRIAKDYPNTPFREEAIVDEQRLLHIAGRDDEAEALFRTMWQDPVMTAQLSPRSTTWKNYITPYIERVGTQWMLYDKPGLDPTLAGVSKGPRIILTKEVQDQLHLPEFVTPEQLRGIQVPVTE